MVQQAVPRYMLSCMCVPWYCTRDLICIHYCVYMYAYVCICMYVCTHTYMYSNIHVVQHYMTCTPVYMYVDLVA